MHWCLIAAGWSDPTLWIDVLKVAIGLGMVIFVHELGHFGVAKLCGVKCEKFYLGFDIAGLKLLKFRWGETEYGIGILPLGGYVKMLGQEDNPARLREEIERARVKTVEGPPPDPAAQAESSAARAQASVAGNTSDVETEVAAAKQALYDPRSFLAQSVPRRMAIISAGVIMNLIFAFVAAAIAFGLGVQQIQSVIGQLVPGAAAWQVNVKVGDEIVEVAGRKTEKFRDVQESISLGDLREGTPIVVRRPGIEKPLTFVVKPDSSGLFPMLGILSSRTTTLSTKKFATLPGTPAAESQPSFQLGDRIVQIDDAPVERYDQIASYLAAHPREMLKVTVERSPDGPSQGDDTKQQPKRLVIDLAPSPMRHLGLSMEVGEIVAVQAESPAAHAGLKPGDLLLSIDGRPIDDPMLLPEQLRRRAGETIAVTLRRDGKEETLKVALRPVDSFASPEFPGDPLAVDALGIAYRVTARVHRVAQGGPADKAGLQPGDEIVAAKLIPPDKSDDSELDLGEIEVKFDRENPNWPFFVYTLQRTLPGTTVELQWVGQKEPRRATMEPVMHDDWFYPDRGLLFEPLTFIQKAESVGKAIRLGAGETANATLLVYRFLQKLGERQVSPRALGGPISIFVVAKNAAEQGTASLLIFLTLLSANLAVINFLPIPLLDGGLMVLLLYEWIRGKPADERVQLVLTYMGLIFILTLMLWVLGLDLGLISRH